MVFGLLCYPPGLKFIVLPPKLVMIPWSELLFSLTMAGYLYIAWRSALLNPPPGQVINMDLLNPPFWLVKHLIFVFGCLNPLNLTLNSFVNRA